MVPSLRKRHRIIWILWLFVIPLGLWMAISIRGTQVIPSEELSIGKTPDSAITVLRAEIDQASIKWSHLASEDSSLHAIQAQVYKPLKAPAAFVYVVPTLEAPLSSSETLGTLGPVGTYTFPLDSNWVSDQGICLVVYDPIKAEKLHTLELVP